MSKFRFRNISRLLLVLACSLNASAEETGWDSVVQAEMAKATKGDMAAAYEVGMAFFNGRGVTRSIDMANYWLRIAASGGEKRAESALRRISSQTNEKSSNQIIAARDSMSSQRYIEFRNETFSSNVVRGARVDGRVACPINFTAVVDRNSKIFKFPMSVFGSLSFFTVNHESQWGTDSAFVYGLEVNYTENSSDLKGGVTKKPDDIALVSADGSLMVSKPYPAGRNDKASAIGNASDHITKRVIDGLRRDGKFNFAIKRSDGSNYYLIQVDINTFESKKMET